MQVCKLIQRAHSAAVKAGLKMLYGVEINLVDDGTPVAYRADEPRDLASAEYVVLTLKPLAYQRFTTK